MPSVLMCTNDGEGGEEEGEKQAMYGSVALLAILEKVWPYRSLGHPSDPSLAPPTTMVLSLLSNSGISDRRVS